MGEAMRDRFQHEAPGARPLAGAEQRDPFARARHRAGEGEGQDLRHFLLGRQVALAGEAHGGGEVAPQEGGLRGRPFHLAQEQPVGLGRLPPVEPAQLIARIILAELPERLAAADAPAAMHALLDGRGNAPRRQQ